MFEKISYYPFNTDWIIVPVPLHWKRVNERGYNQAELIAQNLSRLLTISYAPEAMQRIRYTKTQTQFNKEARSKNLVGSFQVQQPKEILNKNILLIDDVATTLATLEACANALKNVGARNIWGFTVARAE